MSEAQSAQNNGTAGADNSAAEAANNDAQNNGAGTQGGDGGQGDGGQGGGQPSAPAKGTGMDDIDVDAILNDAENAGSGDGGSGDGDGDGGDGGDGQGDGAGSGDGGQGDGDGQGAGDQGGQGDGTQGGDGQGDQNKGGQQDGQGDGSQDEDLGDFNQYTAETVDQFSVKPDDKYGIKPLTDLPDPEKFDGSYNDFFKKEMLPRLVQAVTNVVGIRAKAYDQGVQRETTQKTQAEQARADGWVKQIDELVKTKAIPAYKVDGEGKLDVKSEGGQVITKVFDYMNKLNEKRDDNNKIYDFEVAHRLWKADQAEQANQNNDKQDRQNRREQSRRIAGSTQNTNTRATAAPGLRKGMSLDDIEIE